MDNSHLDHTALPPGTRLYYGKYVISSKIGQGGFGITYKAVQQGLNRAVCIKEYYIEGRCARDFHSHSVRPQNISEEVYEKYRQSFVKESQTLASLHYTGIVEVIDIFDENNTSYMVMPFIEGRTLQDIVDSNGPLKYPEAVNYMAQVANAVGYIHEHHILHRDIKPGNIMITADYKAVLIDFGSAREYVEDKTQSHTSMLTHGYAPPEQYSRTSRKGSYTDIYALGATLYFILTGRVPVEAAARLTEVMPEPRQLNPNIPAEANRTIMKAMQLKPQDRHQNIREFMDDLSKGRSHLVRKKASNSDSDIPQKKNNAGKTQKKKKKINVILLLCVFSALTLVVGIVVFNSGRNGSIDNKPRIDIKKKMQEYVSGLKTEYKNDSERYFGDSSYYQLRSLDSAYRSDNYWDTNDAVFQEFNELYGKQKRYKKIDSVNYHQWINYTIKAWPKVKDPSYGDTVTMTREHSREITQLLKEKKEEILYNQCTTIPKCEEYLKTYPNGRYVDEVKKRMAKLLAQQQPEKQMEINSSTVAFKCLTWDNVKNNGKLFYENYLVSNKGLETRINNIIIIANKLGRNQYEKAWRDVKEKKISPKEDKLMLLEQYLLSSSNENDILLPYAKESKQGFDVIAGFYTNRNTANKMAKRLKSQGCDAYIINKHDVYYVSMGSAPTRTKAEALYNQIKNWYDGDISIKQW